MWKQHVCCNPLKTYADATLYFNLETIYFLVKLQLGYKTFSLACIGFTIKLICSKLKYINTLVTNISFIITIS